jgi:hypothetical protein
VARSIELVRLDVNSLDIESLDIELSPEYDAAMDAFTSLELEAQRRRETIASDRGQALSRAQGTSDAVEARVIAPRVKRAPLGPQGDCQPAPLARNAVG